MGKIASARPIASSTRFDGQFRDNVIIQVKNGPIDFQPREPFSPLFGAMPRTNVGMEFEVTKEYLGFNTHLAYLGTMWEEAMRADTYARGAGSTVARVIDGSLFHGAHSLVAGVANTGNDRNWSGSQFDQANWYALGRFAWDPDASARAVAEDWARMTWGNDPAIVRADRRDDDGLAPGRGRLHDPARPPPSDGDRPPLWARALGRQSRAARLEPDLFPRRQS